MRKLILAGAAAVALIAAPVSAQASDNGAFVGGTAGAWTGGTIGWFLGGPVGAVIGGWTGAAVGASVLSDNVRFGRSPSLDIDYRLDVGVRVDESVRLRAIEGERDYGYFRANGNIYVVDRHTREIVEIRLS